MVNEENKESDLEVANRTALLDSYHVSDDDYSASLGNQTNRTNLTSYIRNYMSKGSAGANNTTNYLAGSDTTYSADYDSNVYSVMSYNLQGIEGMPYQFHENVDRRVPYTIMGRKFADKIFARMPLLFLTPCTAAFMNGFGDVDKKTVASLFMSKDLSEAGEDYGSLIEGQGKFYTPKFAYDEYYQYLNLMLRAVAVFMGIGNEKVKIGGQYQTLNNADWSQDTNSDFKTYFSAKENLVFYMDNFTETSMSVSNSFGDSSLAATINGFADTANEIKFLFGTEGNLIADSIGGATSIIDSVASKLSPLTEKLGGGIVSSISSNGINTVLNGGKIIFPQVWNDSSNDESYSISFKFRSPDSDSLSIYLNVLKPYCKLLCLAMAHQDVDNPNGYTAPFLVKAYSKGMFNVDIGGVSSLNISKGAECQWNNDGLPTQIDVTMDIQNLYSHLAISRYQDGIDGLLSMQSSVVNNTAYMDFLCNMAGLNIAQMEAGRRLKMRLFLTTNEIRDIDNRLFNRFDRRISNILGRYWQL